jgi:hypothetical protein
VPGTRVPGTRRQAWRSLPARPRGFCGPGPVIFRRPVHLLLVDPLRQVDTLRRGCLGPVFGQWNRG